MKVLRIQEPNYNVSNLINYNYTNFTQEFMITIESGDSISSFDFNLITGHEYNIHWH